MDFAGLSGLHGPERGRPIDHDDRHGVIRRLFMIAAARLEAAMTLSGAGQSSALTAADAAAHANGLAVAAQEVVTLSDAIALLAIDL